MKKVISLLLSIVMLFSISVGLTTTVSAETTENGLEYLEYNTVVITGYSGTATEIEIPATINGKNVTEIEGFSFYDCTALTKVIIPDTVLSIGDSAFNGCTELTSVLIGNGVTSIGGQAFYECTKLTGISIGNAVTEIGPYAFSDTGYYYDTENWENGVLYLGNYLIASDSDEISGELKIREGTKLIVGSSLSNCTRMTSVIIPDSVVSICESAFSNCTRLASVEIPSSVTLIEYNPFEGCKKLSSISVAEDNTVYDSRENCNAIVKTDANMIIVGCINTTFPQGVSRIGDER